MKTTTVGTMVCAVVLASAVGCSSAQEPAEKTANVEGAITVPGPGALPVCQPALRGEVFYVQSQTSFVYCDGNAYQPLNLQGNNGHDGTTYLVTTTAATPAQCPTGGVVIEVGPDADKNGVLDSITSATPVCNGAAGPQGPQGAAGAAGQAGATGEGSLVAQSTEPPGANCQNGGTRIDSGLDTNGSGKLDAGEIQQTTYVCAPEATLACAAGTHLCGTAGGALSCSDDTSANTCGSRCTPCPAPDASLIDMAPGCAAGACTYVCVWPYVQVDATTCSSNCNVSNYYEYGANRDYCNLRGAALSSDNWWTGESLRYADFSMATLSEPDFSHANLRNARFAGASVTTADFSDADLSGADFSGFTVTTTGGNPFDPVGAHFGGANLTGATFDDGFFSNPHVFTDSSTICPGGLADFSCYR